MEKNKQKKTTTHELNFESLWVSDVCICCYVNEFISSPAFNCLFSALKFWCNATVFCIHWCSAPTLIVNYVSYFLFVFFFFLNFAQTDAAFFSATLDLAILCILIFFVVFFLLLLLYSMRTKKNSSKTVTSSTKCTIVSGKYWLIRLTKSNV